MKDDIINLFKQQQDLNLLNDIQNKFSGKNCSGNAQVIISFVVVLSLVSIALVISLLFNCRQTRRANKYKTRSGGNSSSTNDGKYEAERLLSGADGQQYFAVVEH